MCECCKPWGSLIPTYKKKVSPVHKIRFDALVYNNYKHTITHYCGSGSIYHLITFIYISLLIKFSLLISKQWVYPIRFLVCMDWPHAHMRSLLCVLVVNTLILIPLLLKYLRGELKKNGNPKSLISMPANGIAVPLHQGNSSIVVSISQMIILLSWYPSIEVLARWWSSEEHIG